MTCKTTHWQSIETMPGDGTEVLLFWPAERNTDTNRDLVSVGLQESDGWWETEGWTAGKLIDKDIIPTHWMPLPEPPPAASL